MDKPFQGSTGFGIINSRRKGVASQKGGVGLLKDTMIQSEISGYISTLLRKHFGKGPSGVFVIVNHPFIAIQIRGFLAPMERLQIKQQEMKRVLETRDLMMMDLKLEIMEGLREVAQLEVNELYADWNLEQETGLILGVMKEKSKEETIPWPDEINKAAFERKVNEASYRSEKVPDSTDLFWLSDRMVLVRRIGILVQIEKELIKNGYMEELKLSKRPLEQRLMKEAGFEEVLRQSISAIFLDWNFKTDVGYVAFILERK